MKLNRFSAFIRAISGLVLLSTMALTGCGSSDVVKSSDVNESKIWRLYRVSYNEKTQSTDIFAQFRVGGSTGTTVTLEKPSSVSVIDTDLKLTGTGPKETSNFGSGYGWNLTGSPVSPSYKFKWTKQSGAVTEDTVTMPTNPALPLLYNSKFKLSDGITIAIDRDAQSAGGKVGATITGIDKVSQQVISTFKSITSGYTVSFTPDEVASFAAGSAELTITTDVEKSASGGASGSLGGTTYATYWRNPAAITLTR